MIDLSQNDLIQPGIFLPSIEGESVSPLGKPPNHRVKFTPGNIPVRSPFANIIPGKGIRNKSVKSIGIVPLRRLAVSESGFIFDPMSGHHFTVNETGLEILRQLQQGRTLTELLALLAREYSVGPKELERDVLEFAGMLRKFVGD